MKKYTMFKQVCNLIPPHLCDSDTGKGAEGFPVCDRRGWGRRGTVVITDRGGIGFKGSDWAQ